LQESHKCLDEGIPILTAHAERFYPWIAEAKIVVQSYCCPAV
jgi:hypothetical protein